MLAFTKEVDIIWIILIKCCTTYAIITSKGARMKKVTQKEKLFG